MLNVQIVQGLPHALIALNGELDMATGSTLETAIKKFQPCQVGSITFLLDELKFIDSTGIGQLIGYYKEYAKYDVPVYIENNNAEIEEILALIGVREIMSP